MRINATTAITYAVLCLFGAGCFTMPDAIPIVSATPIEPLSWEVNLRAVVRDFRASHADFDVGLADGFGHRASNVHETLGFGRPIFNQGHDANGPISSRVAHWKLDDGGGTVVSDEIGLNAGSAEEGPTWVAGHDGGGLHFDGVNDHVHVPATSEMQILGDITFAGWFRLDSEFDGTQDTMVIMEKFLDTEHNFHIGLAGSDYNRAEVPKGSLVFKVENGPTSDYYCYVWTEQLSWTAGVWYHFACALDSSDTTQNRIFIDGVDATDPTMAAGIGFIDTDYDAPLRFGGKTVDYDGHATDIYFEGALDDIMIFDRALDDSDFVTAAGYKVSSQWTSAAGDNIAPHLAVHGPTLKLVSSPVFKNDPTFDTFDSDLGPYGDGNTGPSPGVMTGATMPSVTAPTDLPWRGDKKYKGNKSSTLSESGEYDDFIVENQYELTIAGDVIIVARNKFEIKNNTDVILAAGATLTVYSLKSSKIDNGAHLNVDGDPADLSIYHLGTSDFAVGNGAIIYALVTAPSAGFKQSNNSDFMGTFTGEEFLLESPASFHYDGAQSKILDSCSAAIVDTMGVGGSSSDGGITSEASFDTWFRNVLGTNLAVPCEISLTFNGSVYEYLDDAFFPIDNQMFGNEGMPHNLFFTYTLEATFVYEGCGEQFIEFAGGDGAWLFIDNDLVIDLGGIISNTDQRVDLDRLGLADGESHTLRIFYAQRHASGSVFRLRTNVALSPSGAVMVSAGFD